MIFKLRVLLPRYRSVLREAWGKQLISQPDASVTVEPDAAALERLAHGAMIEGHQSRDARLERRDRPQAHSGAAGQFFARDIQQRARGAALPGIGRREHATERIIGNCR